jgi:hypothetical protein
MVQIPCLGLASASIPIKNINKLCRSLSFKTNGYIKTLDMPLCGTMLGIKLKTPLAVQNMISLTFSVFVI